MRPIFLPPRKSAALNNKKPRTELFHVSIITQSVHSTKTCVSPVSEIQETKGYEFTGGIRVMVNTFAIIKLFLSQLTVRTQQRRAYQKGWRRGQIPWDINAGRVFLWIVAGYVDSITTLPIPSDLAARIPNRSFVHGIRTSRRL